MIGGSLTFGIEIELGKLSATQGSDIQSHLRRYDKSMVERGQSAVFAKMA
jgi:hypothetical protein